MGELPTLSLPWKAQTPSRAIAPHASSVLAIGFSERMSIPRSQASSTASQWCAGGVTMQQKSASTVANASPA
jgi:hypothetical protein